MASVARQDEWFEKICARSKSLGMPVIAQPDRVVELEFAAPPIALSCNGISVHVVVGFYENLLGEVLAVLKRV